MDYDSIFTALMLIILAILLFSAVITLLGCAIACIADKNRRNKALEQTNGGFTTTGVFSDVQCVYDTEKSWQPYHFKLAIQFQGADGGWHRAFIGITTSVQLQFQPGQQVALHILPTPVIQADASAFDPNRGADGKISGIINFRKWMDKPIDETGTVMLESDYQDFVTESQNKIKRDSDHALWWFIASGASVVIGILMLFGAAALS